MHRNILAGAIFALLSLLSPQARADSDVIVVTSCGGEILVPKSSYTLSQDATGKLCVNASVSASITGFQSNGNFANLTATASSSASTALPAGATSVRITNTGSGTVSCTFATGAATGVVNNIQVGPSSSVSRAVGSYDHIACIDQTGSSGSQLVVVEGGSGLGNDTGGGSSTGGGSNASVSATSSAVPGSATYMGILSGGNLVGWDKSVTVASPVQAVGPTAVGSANANPPVVIGGTVTGAAGQNVQGLAIKPASTAPVATDLAAVVALSPNGNQATAANQATNSATTTHTCSTAGFSELGCLGQLDDDIKAAGSISQTTQGTTNGVTNGANNTNTVAASATAFVLSATQGGGTGATGDYLSHCVLQPGTTSPGAVTIADNSTTIFSFTGGASSVSNLLPMPIPFGAVSKSGGWKVTTGTNVTLFCVGKFS